MWFVSVACSFSWCTVFHYMNLWHLSVLFFFVLISATIDGHIYSGHVWLFQIVLLGIYLYETYRNVYISVQRILRSEIAGL